MRSHPLGRWWAAGRESGLSRRGRNRRRTKGWKEGTAVAGCRREHASRNPVSWCTLAVLAKRRRGVRAREEGGCQLHLRRSRKKPFPQPRSKTRIEKEWRKEKRGLVKSGEGGFVHTLILQGNRVLKSPSAPIRQASLRCPKKRGERTEGKPVHQGNGAAKATQSKYA